MALSNTITSVADAIRTVTGKSDKMTLKQMAREIKKLEVPADTYVLVTEDGNEYTGVMTHEEVTLTAIANDIREGTTGLTVNGVTKGTAKIPAYHTWQGVKLIPNGSNYSIPNIDPVIDYHDFTEMQSMICVYNTSTANSVATEKVTIGDKLYAVESTEAISTLTKNSANKSIDYGVVNSSGSLRVIRFFMYKEVK